MSSNHLYHPAQLGPFSLKNRIVMGPMTRCRATEEHVPTDVMVQYYQQRSTAGLIITEGTNISPSSIGYANVPGIFNNAQVAGWKKITDAVHAAGSHIFVQLWHVGRVSNPIFINGQTPVAPSAIAAEGELHSKDGLVQISEPKALSIDGIQSVIAEFKQAAEFAKAAGFDGVELHGAYSYLIEQFLRDGSNVRTDQYGGSVENRCRFVFEVIDAVSEVFPQNQIGLRISPINIAYQPFHIIDSHLEATYSHLVEKLNHYDLAYLHVVEQIGGAEFNPNINFDVNTLSSIYQGTYLANGGYDSDKASKAIENKHADFIAMSSSFIANPDLLNRMQHHLPLNQPNFDKLYVGGADGYSDYPCHEDA